MLKKVIGIKNVGKFADCKAAGDVEFRGLTLIFGENGRGKTTLCGVLRSLATGDASYISERQRLGTSEAPEIKFLTDSGTPAFEDGSWDTNFPELTVFDSCYVHENVYAGDFVAHEHKKNLHRVIVGKQGVDLNQKIADLDSESRQVAKDLRGVTAELKAAIPKGVTLEEFLPLAENPQADEQLVSLEAEIVALKRAKDIAEAASLKEIIVPSLPSGYEELLKQQLPDVSADAEAKVREHLAHSAANASHGWAEQGLKYIKDETCPFCGEGLTANQVIQAYREYFSEAYTTLKDNASAMKGDVAKAFTDMVIERIGTTVESNHQGATFWKEFVELDSEPELPEDYDWRKALLAFREAAGKYATQKAETPLEMVIPGTDYDEAVALVEQVRKNADAYNEIVRHVNAAIEERKQATSGGDLAAKAKEASIVAAAKVRYEDTVAAKCDEYAALTARKSEIETEKNEAKAELDEGLAEQIRSIARI